MPDISLDMLAGIPGVNQGAMVQPGSGSCGAYAIVSAVGAHGAFPQAATLSYADTIAHTGLHDDFHALAGAVYTVTGILNIGMFGPIDPELDTAGKAYNSPAAMAKVAMDLGRPTPQINVQQDGLRRFANLYPDAQSRWETVAGAGNVNVNAGAYVTPGTNETHVVYMDTGFGPHWVAQGSNGRFYDPVNGSLNNSWTIEGDDMSCPYTFAGLWIVIR